MFLWIKALHVIAVISWMAGLFYLPRLFIYHVEALDKGDKTDTFKVMQEKLLRIIMNPAMIVAWLAGLYMVITNFEGYSSEIWFWVKIICVLSMTWFHMLCAKWRKQLLTDSINYNSSYFRKMNEIPTVLMIVIVVMVIVRPF